VNVVISAALKSVMQITAAPQHHFSHQPPLLTTIFTQTFHANKNQVRRQSGRGRPTRGGASPAGGSSATAGRASRSRGRMARERSGTVSGGGGEEVSGIKRVEVELN
jgi:hypothetical protein